MQFYDFNKYHIFVDPPNDIKVKMITIESQIHDYLPTIDKNENGKRLITAVD